MNLNGHELQETSVTWMSGQRYWIRFTVRLRANLTDLSSKRIPDIYCAQDVAGPRCSLIITTCAPVAYGDSL